MPVISAMKLRKTNMKLSFRVLLPALPMGLALMLAAPLSAQGSALPPAPTFADLADLADPADAVIRAEIRKQAEVKPERAPGLQPGHVRLYIEVRTVALLKGSRPVGESLRYLVDLPLDERGRAPRLKKREVILFTRPANGRPGEIALTGPGAQLDWSADVEQRLRPILSALARPDAPPAITGVREALSVPGNLVGESETQFFLSTTSELVSISVLRRPGMAPAWGVAWDEIVDQAASPPTPDTLEWYRLACFLPDTLPRAANISADASARTRAETDYRFVRAELGPCPRNRS